MKNILITLPVVSGEIQDFMDAISDCSNDWKLYFADEGTLDDSLLSTADVIIGMVSPDRLAVCKNLSWLQLGWAGAEKYALRGLIPDDCILSCASGAYGTAVAEHMVALTLALSCRLNRYVLQQKDHIWKLIGRDDVINGSTVLVYGMGDIGTHYAQIMKPMNCKVIGIRRTVSKEMPYGFDEQYTASEADELIGQADIIAFTLPGGDETRHIFGEKQMSKVKQGALLINVGRGSTIDTVALIKALHDGTLGGAALDVFEEEPLGENLLWDMDNVIITPHAAGKLEDPYNRRQVVRLCVNNLFRYTHGMLPEHIAIREQE